MTLLLDLFRYFAFCVIDGDWQNDFLTHLPDTMTAPLMEMGQAIAVIFGSL